jgi:acetyl esterase/lipase
LPDIKSYVRATGFIFKLVQNKETVPAGISIKDSTYPGISGEEVPLKIFTNSSGTKDVVILYPGASPYGEYHPKMLALGAVLAESRFTVFIPRIPPLKELDISEINIQWFNHFYKWMLEKQQVPAEKIAMVGLSYGGGLMLKSLLETNGKLPSPKAILTYGTYSDGRTIVQFLLNGEISLHGSTYTIPPHEWGLVVIFHNFLKNLSLDWDSTKIQTALTYQISENFAERDKVVDSMPKDQQNLFHSILKGEATPEIKALVDDIVENEEDAFINLSPKFWGDKIKEKVFILHGANDSMVPFTESIKLADYIPENELLISYIYEHKEISNNRGYFFTLREISRLINFYAKFFHHYAH